MNNRFGFIFLALIILLSSHIAAEIIDVNLDELDYSNLWFEPKLTEESDPFCKTIEKDLKKLFLSNANSYFDHFNKVSKSRIYISDELQREPDHFVINKSKIFYTERHIGGCGGYCDSNYFLLSKTPFPETYDNTAEPFKTLLEKSPEAPGYNSLIYFPDNNSHYLLIIKKTVSVYKATEDATWSKICEIVTEPSDIEISSHTKEIQESINQLDKAINNITMGNRCGTRGAYSWEKQGREARQKLLYRPWEYLNKKTDEFNSTDSTYDIDMTNLEIWSKNGLYETKKFEALKEQLNKTENELSSYYQKNFKWDESTANTVAKKALQFSASVGVRFYMYDPLSPSELAIRNAILDKLPIPTIKEISFDYYKYNNRKIDVYDESENLINLAIESPELIQFFLDQGISPNATNPFHKTPLMYAAQYNQLESAKLLLKHGANINSFTIIPENSCYYNLSKSGMTALHYAVRYASPEFIELLLDAGANPYATTSESSGGYPIDWLKKYTDPKAEEPNINIPKNKIFQLEERLTLPPPEKIIKKIISLNLDAEKNYQEGNPEAAYTLLQEAINLNPSDERSLSNMSLIAHKVGKTGIALEAIQKIISQSKSASNLANAWFNYGLICELKNKTFYNGNTYCDHLNLDSYIKSYSLSPTPARANKIIGTIKNGFCQFESKSAIIIPRCGKYSYEKQMCIMAPTRNSIDFSGIAWKNKKLLSRDKGFPVYEEHKSSLGKLLKTYDLGEYQLHKYIFSESLNFPIYWDSEHCDEKHYIFPGKINI